MFNADIELAAKRHAALEWPKESVGLVIEGAYCPVKNTHEDPTKHFRFDSKLLAIHSVQGVIHSHPDGNYQPSINDQEQAIATALPWGIVPCADRKPGEIFWWGPGVETPPLIGREYRLGPVGSDGKSDCYGLVRDYYRTTRNVELPEVPRNVELYLKQTPWYDTLFQKFGFHEIRKDEVRQGDLILLRIRQNVANHALIMAENGLVLHHFDKKLSGRSPLGRYEPFIVRCIRYG